MRWPVIAGIFIAGVLVLAGAIALASTRAEPGPAGRVIVPAPIERVEILIRESAPPQVSVKITAGLPSGCAQRETHSVSRTGDRFVVRVLNSMPQGEPACTMIYGTYDLSVDLGGEFLPGTTYTVQVNDTTATFKT